MSTFKQFSELIEVAKLNGFSFDQKFFELLQRMSVSEKFTALKETVEVSLLKAKDRILFSDTLSELLDYLVDPERNDKLNRIYRDFICLEEMRSFIAVDSIHVTFRGDDLDLYDKKPEKPNFNENPLEKLFDCFRKNMIFSCKTMFNRMVKEQGCGCVTENTQPIGTLKEQITEVMKEFGEMKDVTETKSNVMEQKVRKEDLKKRESSVLAKMERLSFSID